MKVDMPPKVTSFLASGLWEGYACVKGIFFKRHNLPENLEVVVDETDGLEITSCPNSWVVLDEINNSMESTYLDEFTCCNGIIRINPIVDPFSEQNANIADVEKTLAALAVLVMEYLDFIDNFECGNNKEKTAEITLKEFLDKKVFIVAKCFDVRIIDLQKMFLSLPWNKEEFWNEVKILQSKRQKLIDESNRQSRQHLTRILDDHKKPHIFITTGIAHEEVFKP